MTLDISMSTHTSFRAEPYLCWGYVTLVLKFPLFSLHCNSFHHQFSVSQPKQTSQEYQVSPEGLTF